MSDDFMERLAPKVAGVLPVKEGEGLDDYCGRLREQNEGARALIGVCFRMVFDEIAAKKRAMRRVAKDAWIASARKAFAPGPRQACAVCDKYPYLTHAHHLYPLAQQYEDGVLAVDQRSVWLCPNHHAMVHLMIDTREMTSQAIGRRAAPVVLDLEGDELNRVLVILEGRS